jgi:hypothetical protein
MEHHSDCLAAIIADPSDRSVVLIIQVSLRHCSCVEKSLKTSVWSYWFGFLSLTFLYRRFQVCLPFVEIERMSILIVREGQVPKSNAFGWNFKEKWSRDLCLSF